MVPQGNWPPPELTATPKAKHINNSKSNYHHHPDFATNLHSKHTEHSERDVRSGNSKPTFSFPGRSQGLCYLPSNQYDSSAVLWMLLLVVGKVLLITQKNSRDTCLLYHCIPIHLTFMSSICVDHFITAWAGGAFALLQVLYVSHKLKPLLQILHPNPETTLKECHQLSIILTDPTSHIPQTQSSVIVSWQVYKAWCLPRLDRLGDWQPWASE